MAIVVGTVESITEVGPAAGPSLLHTISGTEYEVRDCLVFVSWPTGTYAQADDATFAPKAAIEASQQDGRTVTILQAACVGSGKENASIVAAGACTVSSDVVTTSILQEDLSTERANGAMSANWLRPIAFRVSYRQQVG